MLLEAGYGGDHDAWSAVEPELARAARVCAYDRAGLGLSAAEHPPRRGPFEQEDDLDDLLDAAGVEAPYVIVGHSYGGHFVQSYLGQPDLVVRAIDQVVKAARAHRPPRPCRQLFRPPGARCRGG